MNRYKRLSYAELQYVIDNVTNAGMSDKANGKHFLEEETLSRLCDLAKNYRQKRSENEKAKAELAIHREHMKELGVLLSRHVRNLHFIFKRMHKTGDVDPVDMQFFQIPTQALRQTSDYLDFWSERAETIVRCYHKREKMDKPPLPPYVISKPIVTLLDDLAQKGMKAVLELHRIKPATQDANDQLKSLKFQVAKELGLARRQMDVSLYKKPASFQQEMLESYGFIGKRHHEEPQENELPELD